MAGMKTLFYGLIVLTAAGLVVAGPSKQDLVKKDKDGIQGTWKLIGLEADGQQAPAEIVATLKLVFKEDMLAFTPGEPGFTNYKFKLDPTTKPASITLIHAHGTHQGEAEMGIYLLDGDHLKICVGAAGKVPKEFTTRAKSGQGMYSLERMK
jgi:uncharacterized protein (TIGR03067 family)